MYHLLFSSQTLWNNEIMFANKFLSALRSYNGNICTCTFNCDKYGRISVQE